MTATYTFDVFASLDGYGSYGEGGDWGGYWGKQGPELLAHRFDQFGTEQRMIFGATTFRQFVEMRTTSPDDADVFDEEGNANGADVFNGGAAADAVDYGGRQRPVGGDNDGVADDGAPGEGDDVRPDVEQVTLPPSVRFTATAPK